MRDQVSVVGILWIILGALTMLASAFVGLLGGGGMIMGMMNAGHDRDAAAAGTIMAGLFGVIAVFIFVMGLVALLAGIGLRKWRPWARILTIILSILNLLSFPIGTAIGVYSLVVLFNADVVAAFNSQRA
jgi:hypothetical protein